MSFFLPIPMASPYPRLERHPGLPVNSVKLPACDRAPLAYRPRHKWRFLCVFGTIGILAATVGRGDVFHAPASPRITYNFNPDWKFIRADATGAERPEFDDSTWTAVSTPHTWNDVDSYR